MSYAFYPADLLLPPVTGFRTAISMLLLLLAGSHHPLLSPQGAPQRFPHSGPAVSSDL